MRSAVAMSKASEHSEAKDIGLTLAIRCPNGQRATFSSHRDATVKVSCLQSVSSRSAFGPGLGEPSHHHTSAHYLIPDLLAVAVGLQDLAEWLLIQCPDHDPRGYFVCTAAPPLHRILLYPSYAAMLHNTGEEGPLLVLRSDTGGGAAAGEESDGSEEEDTAAPASPLDEERLTGVDMARDPEMTLRDAGITNRDSLLMRKVVELTD